MIREGIPDGDGGFQPGSAANSAGTSQMRKYGVQFILGAWIALAVGMGIMTRSWETFFSLLLVCAFFAAGLAAGEATRSGRLAIRRAGAVGVIAFCGVILGFALLGAERVYLASGTSYPAWLASGDLGPINGIDRYFFVGSGSRGPERAVLDSAPGCANQGAEFHQKEGGVVVIRCGGLMWFDSHTYIAHTGVAR